MRAALLLALALLLAGPPAAWAQLPDALRSSRLTVAQEQELTRRLGALQGRFVSLAQETALREDAVRNIAIEIFGAQPGLDFDAYAGLIDSGARALRTYISDAQNRSSHDPAVAALRQRALDAAEAGRLTEARALYDQAIAATRANRAAQRQAQDLAEARELAASARLAFVSADFLDAARRYGEAAALAPQGGERDLWLESQAEALVEQGYLTAEASVLEAAIAVIDGNFASAAPAQQTAIWRMAQILKANALRLLGETSDPAKLQDAAALFRELIAATPRDGDPETWRVLQQGLADVLTRMGENGDRSALRASVEASAAALSATSSDTPGWAAMHNSLGASMRQLGQAERDSSMLHEAIDAFETTRAASAPNSQMWVAATNNLAATYQILGQLGEADALTRAIDAYRALLPVLTRGSYEWAVVQYNLGTASNDRAAAGCGRRCYAEAVGYFEASLAALEGTGAASLYQGVAGELARARANMQRGE